MIKNVLCVTIAALALSTANAFGQYTVSQFNALPSSQQDDYYRGSVQYFIAKVEPYDHDLVTEMRAYFLEKKNMNDAPGYTLFFSVLRKNDPAEADTKVDTMMRSLCSHHWGTRFGKAMYAAQQHKQ